MLSKKGQVIEELSLDKQLLIYELKQVNKFGGLCKGLNSDPLNRYIR